MKCEVGRYIFDRPNFSPLKLRSRRSPPIALAMKGFSPACCFAVLMAELRPVKLPGSLLPLRSVVVLEFPSSKAFVVVISKTACARIRGVRRGIASCLRSEKPPRTANAKEHAIDRLIQTSFRVHRHVL